MRFHDDLKKYIHQYVKFIYSITKKFPKDEIYGVTSQFRRAGMSIMLNYIEGFAGNNDRDSKIYKHFLKISYGSLKETKYLLYFSFDVVYINKEEYGLGLNLSDNIGKMLWSLIK